MPRTALIDADVLRYECASVGQDKDGNIQNFDFVRKVFDERIDGILLATGCEDYILFLTGDKHSTSIINRQRRFRNEPELHFEPNFREALAKGKVYKGTRTKDKPFHWINLTAYILSTNLAEISNGREADDSIAIKSFERPNEYIICTRDKDLRMVPGWHYGWECGKQPEFGPVEYDNIGKIELLRSKPPKIKGGGFAFFCSQLLTGDVVDNIGGLPGHGPVKAWEVLQYCTTERTYFSAVIGAYRQCFGDEEYRTALREQCSLLWIIRERNPDGSLKHFNLEEWL